MKSYVGGGLMLESKDGSDGVVTRLGRRPCLFQTAQLGEESLGCWDWGSRFRWGEFRVGFDDGRVLKGVLKKGGLIM